MEATPFLFLSALESPSCRYCLQNFLEYFTCLFRHWTKRLHLGKTALLLEFCFSIVLLLAGVKLGNMGNWREEKLGGTFPEFNLAYSELLLIHCD